MVFRNVIVGSCIFVLFVVVLRAAPPGDENEPRYRSFVDECWYGNAEAVAALLEQGANPNATRRGGRSALHLAAQGGHLKVMRLLIDHGADVQAKGSHGRTVLTEAAASRDPQAVRMLLEAGAEPDGSALGMASWLGHIEAAKLLLEAGVSPDEGLFGAAQGGHVEILGLLLHQGANVNARFERGTTALHAGALQGGLETVRLLLKEGADPNATNDEAETPLHMALSGDREIETVELLVGSGAKLDLPDNEGVTPVRRAAISGEKTVYDWLVAAAGGKEPPVLRSAVQGPQTAKPTQELIAALSSRNREDRLAAQRELVARGEQVMPDVLESIEQGTGIEHFYGLFAAMGSNAKAALPLLESLLSDKEQVFAAAIAIDRMNPGAVAGLAEDTKQKAAAALYEATIDPDADVMTGMCAGLLVGMENSAVPTILRLLRHEQPRYRALAARELASAKFSDGQLQAELLDMLDDDTTSVRSAAAAALGEFGEPTPEMRSALLSLMKNAPPYDPQASQEGLEKMRHWQEPAEHAARSLGRRFGPGIIDDLLPLLSPMDAPERRPAIAALESIGAPAVPRLIELLAHEDSSVAISASVALNRIGPPAVPALAAALRTDSEQTIEHAAGALWWIGPGAKDALPALFDVAGSDRRSNLSRLAAARAATKIDPTKSRESEAILSTIPMLIALLENGDSRRQSLAAETLGGIGPAARDALPALRKRRDLASDQAISAIEKDPAEGSGATP